VQRFGVLCGVLCGCYARIRCGFPVKKGISVGIRYQAVRAGCGHFRMRVRVRCQTNKLSKQARAWCCGGAGAVRVQGCGLISKQGLGAGLSAVR